MRDLALLTLVLALVPVILARSHVGALAYHGFSLMNPHRLVWGFAYGQPFGLLFAALTGLAWLLHPERRRPATTPLFWLLLVFALWMSFTTFAVAWAPEAAFDNWWRFIKLLLMLILSLALLAEPSRLQHFVAVVALALGFFAIKGGLFVLLTGGRYLVCSPLETPIGDNNGLALALVTVLPLLVYLAEGVRGWWRWPLWAVVWLDVIAILGTRSRGGFVALAATAMVLWWQSRHRLALGLAGLAAAAVALALLPPDWYARIASIEDYARDPSFALRLRVWRWTLEEVVAAAPLWGGGFGVFTLNGIRHSQEEYLNAHSIFFEVLGEHGLVGLALFLALLAGGVLTALRTARAAAGCEELAWVVRLGRLLPASYVGYATAGAFLNMAFFDLLYQLLAITILARALVRDHQAAPLGAADPLGRDLAAGGCEPATGSAPVATSAHRAHDSHLRIGGDASKMRHDGVTPLTFR